MFRCAAVSGALLGGVTLVAPPFCLWRARVMARCAGLAALTLTVTALLAVMLAPGLLDDVWLEGGDP